MDDAGFSRDKVQVKLVVSNKVDSSYLEVLPAPAKDEGAEE